jgi:hypothetical protein
MIIGETYSVRKRWFWFWVLVVTVAAWSWPSGTSQCDVFKSERGLLLQAHAFHTSSRLSF